MLRQAIFGRLAGYEDVHDAERLRVDPAGVVRSGPGPHPAVRCATAIGAAWLTHVPERKVGDSSGGQRLMLRRHGTEPLFPRRRGQDCNDGAATQERIAARKGLLLESSGSFGYDCGLKSDN